MYRKGFVYTASAIFIPLILTPQKCWTWGIFLRWLCRHCHRCGVMETSSQHCALCSAQANKPCPCFESTWMKHYSLCTWAGKAARYCTLWTFSHSLICRSLYYTVQCRVDVSLKKKYRECCSEFWKHEGMITPDIKAGRYTTTSNKYDYIFITQRTQKFLNSFSNNYDKLVLPARSSFSNRIQW